MESENEDSQETAKQLESINTLLTRLAEAGWLAQTAIKPGALHIEFTERGLANIQRVRVLLGELSVRGPLRPGELVALAVLADRYG